MAHEVVSLSGIEAGQWAGHYDTERIDRARLKVLLGPSYFQLEDFDSIQWAPAAVRYLKKERGSRDPRCIAYDLGSIARGIAGKAVEPELADLILRLNADTNCFFMAERERTSLFGGALLAPVYIADCTRYAWSILKDERPDLVVFHNTPHEMFTYALLKAALHLKIPTFMVQYSALPWRMRLCRYEPDGSAPPLRMKEQLSDGERASVRSYMLRLQASHDNAIPFTNLDLISRSGRDLYFGDEVRAALKGSEVVKNLVRIVKKRALYRTFTSFVTDKVPVPYVVFLMHFQPEETTIPRGGMFSQQLNAVLKLRACLPARVNIVVKENRAMFRAPLTLAIGVRSREFYRSVASLPGTYLVPLARDTFDLVDNALAVATITGSVGMEALCRGKKVIAFGDANYSHFHGVTRLDVGDVDCSSLAHAIDGPAHDPARTIRDLEEEVRYSIGVSVENNETNFQSQRAATIEGFEYVAQHLERLLAHT